MVKRCWLKDLKDWAEEHEVKRSEGFDHARLYTKTLKLFLDLEIEKKTGGRGTAALGVLEISRWIEISSLDTVSSEEGQSLRESKNVGKRMLRLARPRNGSGRDS